jgi:hypothetical protein
MVCICFFLDEEESQVEKFVGVPAHADAIERVDGILGRWGGVGCTSLCGGETHKGEVRGEQSD